MVPWDVPWRLQVGVGDRRRRVKPGTGAASPFRLLGVVCWRILLFWSWFRRYQLAGPWEPLPLSTLHWMVCFFRFWPIWFVAALSLDAAVVVAGGGVWFGLLSGLRSGGWLIASSPFLKLQQADAPGWGGSSRQAGMEAGNEGFYKKPTFLAGAGRTTANG